MGEQLAVFVILGHAIYHLLQRDDACRGQNARLAHTSAQRFADAVRPFDEGAAANQHRSYGRAESFGEAEHHRIHAAHQFADRHVERDGGVKYACAIQVYVHAVRVRQRSERLHLFQVQHGAAAAIVGIFDAQQYGWRGMFVAAI